MAFKSRDRLAREAQERQRAADMFRKLCGAQAYVVYKALGIQVADGHVCSIGELNKKAGLDYSVWLGEESGSHIELTAGHSVSSPGLPPQDAATVMVVFADGRTLVTSYATGNYQANWARIQAAQYNNRQAAVRQQEQQKPVPQPVICPYCRCQNPADCIACLNCGAPRALPPFVQPRSPMGLPV